MGAWGRFKLSYRLDFGLRALGPGGKGQAVCSLTLALPNRPSPRQLLGLGLVVGSSERQALPFKGGAWCDEEESMGWVGAMGEEGKDEDGLGARRGRADFFFGFGVCICEWLRTLVCVLLKALCASLPSTCP